MLVYDAALAKKKKRIYVFPRRARSSGDLIMTSRGMYQRLIVISLAFHLSSMTRGALAKVIAKKLGITWKIAYNHVMNELNGCLVPNGIVIENGSIPSLRGPRICQATGIPCYRLSDTGILLVCSLEELDMELRKNLLKQLLDKQHDKSSSGGSHSESQSNDLIDTKQRQELLAHLERYPQFTLELVKSGVIKFLEGEISRPLDIIPK
ncbi:MAG TPA: hypothetical protein VF172_10970 [Nitrososphaera sp.]|jgi:hypothetical protein